MTHVRTDPKDTDLYLPECPFCGGAAEVIGTMDTNWVTCLECFACSDVVETVEEAVALWCRRVGK